MENEPAIGFWKNRLCRKNNQKSMRGHATYGKCTCAANAKN